MKTQAPVDYPDAPGDPALARHPHGPLAAWLVVALVGLALGAAALAAAFTTDTRDFAARHGTVLQACAL